MLFLSARKSPQKITGEYYHILNEYEAKKQMEGLTKAFIMESGFELGAAPLIGGEEERFWTAAWGRGTQKRNITWERGNDMGRAGPETFGPSTSTFLTLCLPEDHSLSFLCKWRKPRVCPCTRKLIGGFQSQGPESRIMTVGLTTKLSDL